MKRVTESDKTWERRAVSGIMEGASDERDPLPSIKPPSETPAKEDDKMSEQPTTNNITGLRRLEKCHHLDISSYPARALRALGLLLADGAPTVGRGKTF